MCLAQRNACAGSHGIAKGCNLSGRGLRVTARNWQRTRNILAYPHAWQRPAKTEEWAYERCLADLPENRYVQFVFFPWATLIDLLRAERTEKAQPFLDALKAVPPRTTLIRATVCQHIYAKDLLPWFKCLKITDLFWSHATREESAIEGLRVHPFPLYPVRCAEYPEIAASGGKPLNERKYLYGFIGTYEPGLYLSPVRQWIFDLPLRADAPVESRPEWHFRTATGATAAVMPRSCRKRCSAFALRVRDRTASGCGNPSASAASPSSCPIPCGCPAMNPSGRAPPSQPRKPGKPCKPCRTDSKR
jgi:hypothetical protein